jgi:hypothetical protein
MRGRNQIAVDGPTDKAHKQRSETVDEGMKKKSLFLSSYEMTKKIFLFYLVFLN